MDWHSLALDIVTRLIVGAVHQKSWDPRRCNKIAPVAKERRVSLCVIYLDCLSTCTFRYGVRLYLHLQSPQRPRTPDCCQTHLEKGTTLKVRQSMPHHLSWQFQLPIQNVWNQPVGASLDMKYAPCALSRTESKAAMAPPPPSPDIWKQN